MKTEIKNNIKRLEALLEGKEVDGMKMGDAGLDYKWIIETIHNLNEILKGM